MIGLEIFLGIVAVVLLIAYRRGRNAIWGGLTIGIVIGIIVVLYQLISGIGFNWIIIIRTGVFGTLIGYIIELLGKLSDLIKRT